MGQNEAWQQELEQLAESRGPESGIHHPSPSLTPLKTSVPRPRGRVARLEWGGPCALGPFFLVYAGRVVSP